MTELSKLFPVVIATVQLAVLLIVPVSQVVTAHRTSKETEKKHNTQGYRGRTKDFRMDFEM